MTNEHCKGILPVNWKDRKQFEQVWICYNTVSKAFNF